MRKGQLLLLALLLLCCSVSQVLAAWVKYSSVEEWRDIVSVASGYLVLGSLHTDTGQKAITLTLFDKEYRIVWTKKYQTDVSVEAVNILPQGDDGYLIVGQIDTEQESLALVFKVDNSGNIEWQKAYSFGEEANTLALKALKRDFSYFIFGNSCTEESCSAFLLELSLEGEVKSARLYQSPENFNVLEEVQILENGFLIAGKVVSSNGLDFWLAEIDQEGQVSWSKSYGGEDTELLNDMAILPDGLLLVGETTSGEDDQGDALIVKLNTRGDLLWHRIFGHEGPDRAQKVFPQGEIYVVVGETNSASADLFWSSFTSQGALLQTISFSSPEDEHVGEVLPDKELLLVGQSGTQGLFLSFSNLSESDCTSFNALEFSAQSLTVFQQDLPLQNTVLSAVSPKETNLTVISQALSLKTLCMDEVSPMKGDASQDQKIDVIDALLVARCALGLSETCVVSITDVNCDEKVNVIDALLIARKALLLDVPSWCSL